MTRISSLLPAFALVLALSFVAACGDKSEESGPETAGSKTFTFTAIPHDDESKQHERFDPMAEYLSEALGIKVEFKNVADYAAAVSAMTNGDVFMAWFGGLTGVQARARTKGEAIAQGQEDKAFYSYFIAHKSVGMEMSDTFPKDIAGKTFTFGSKGSTSGRLMPEYFLRKEFGKAPDDVFKKVGFSGSHSNTLRAVADGSFEIGAIDFTVWETAVAEGKTGDAVAIWKSPEYFDYNWSVPGNLEEYYGDGFKAKLKAAILALDPAKPKHKAILDAFARTRFIAAENSNYQAIEDTAKSLDLIR